MQLTEQEREALEQVIEGDGVNVGVGRFVGMIEAALAAVPRLRFAGATLTEGWTFDAALALATNGHDLNVSVDPDDDLSIEAASDHGDITWTFVPLSVIDYLRSAPTPTEEEAHD